MRRLPFSTPSWVSCQVVGEVYEDSDPAELSEDMLDVEMPNGVLISVGWYPYGDSNGRYYVRLSRGGRLLIECDTQSAFEANEIAQEWVGEYSWRDAIMISHSASEDSTHKMTVA